MSVSIEVFRLFSYRPCGHELLVRVRRPAASNADQGALAAADSFADSITTHLRTWWEQWHLRRECSHQHVSSLVAEMQQIPAGEELLGPGLRQLSVWVAETKYGAPWVVLGTAPTEAQFWQLVQDDSDLLDLGPRPHAVLHQVFLLTDEDGQRDLSAV